NIKDEKIFNKNMDENLAIEVKNLTKSFGKNVVIQDLSFNINRSEKVAIFAPSGSGKTTLLNILSGIDKNYSGFFNINYSYSFVFQESRLFPYMTAIQNILLALQLRKISITDEILKKIDEWMQITSLKGYEKYYPYELSGGMKAKIALIRAFIIEPKIIFMDEPFKSIDIQSKQTIINYIKDKYKDLTMLLVTHNIDELPLIGGKILKFQVSPLSKYDEIIIEDNLSISEIIYKLF
ncbi:MAG: ATP-binding cassette domain-containing protein, partial [Spirochaetota bacterium]